MWLLLEVRGIQINLQNQRHGTERGGLLRPAGQLPSLTGASGPQAPLSRETHESFSCRVQAGGWCKSIWNVELNKTSPCAPGALRAVGGQGRPQGAVGAGGGASDPTWVWGRSGGLPAANEGTGDVKQESSTVRWGFGPFLSLRTGAAVLSKDAAQLGPLHANMLPRAFAKASQESRQPALGGRCEPLYSMDSEAEACRKSQGQIWILSESSGLPAASEPRGSTDNLMNPSCSASFAISANPAGSERASLCKQRHQCKKDRQTDRRQHPPDEAGTPATVGSRWLWHVGWEP